MEAFAELERIAAREVGRGSEALAAHTAGSLYRAAATLAAAPQVVILTGFYIPAADPPGGETDGPIGAVQLAAALSMLDVPVRLLTDEPCAPVVRAAIEAAGLDVPLDVAPVPVDDEWVARLLAEYETVTCMLAIERVGPAADGIPRNMRGVDISAHTAALDRVYSAGEWHRIGIGDGGNELGMGKLAPEVVAAVVDGGDRIHCAVTCSELIVGGTSNWAASALTAALALLRPAPALTSLLDPDWSLRVLTHIVEHGGAVDGVRRAPALSVDGLDWDDYAAPLAELAEVVGRVQN
ncbi:glutamate cyclase domain-containing protein [Longispora albida]|uniref:glutamate cyclase domain-containing protein n=1 Tax=Longispora albida TaxID=203523 RepID=UPI00037F6DA8|nr:glutamate cyclase domain-containing protein [Longispora albida]